MNILKRVKEIKTNLSDSWQTAENVQKMLERNNEQIKKRKLETERKLEKVYMEYPWMKNNSKPDQLLALIEDHSVSMDAREEAYALINGTTPEGQQERTAMTLTSEQHKQLLELIINEEVEDFTIELTQFDKLDDISEMELIFQTAKRSDLRGQALSKLANNELFSREKLHDSLILANEISESQSLLWGPWREAEEELKKSIKRINDPEFIVELIQDPDINDQSAASFLHSLFYVMKKPSNIDKYQDEGVKAYIDRKRNVQNLKWAVPKEKLELCLSEPSSVFGKILTDNGR